MGFFGGIIGGLLGGGGTKVTSSSKTEVNTKVDVNLSNIIDLSGLEGILKQLKDFIVSDGNRDAEFKSLIAKQGEEENQLSKQNQTLLLLGTAVEAEKNKQFSEINKTIKLALLGGGALGVYYVMRSKK